MGIRELEEAGRRRGERPRRRHRPLPALACDLILAAESAFFGLAFVNIGLMPDGGSTLFVPATVGKARAFQMAMLGERIDAQRRSTGG